MERRKILQWLQVFLFIPLLGLFAGVIDNQIIIGLLCGLIVACILGLFLILEIQAT